MANKTCGKCNGAKKISSENGEPWSQYTGVPYNDPRMEKVRSGEETPQECPECKGQGTIPDEPQETKPKAPKNRS